MKIQEQISWKSLANKIVAVNTTTGEYYTMNLVASMIWQWISEGKEEQEILNSLSEKFPDIEQSTLNQDLKEQLDEWRTENLIN